MRKIVMLFALIASLLLASVPAAAQGTPEADFNAVDIESAAEATLATDLDDLLTDMEEPIDESLLPTGFSAPEFVDPEKATSDDLVLPAEDLAFSEGSVAYSIDYEPDTTGFSIGMSSLTFVFVDGEITASDMDDFKEGATQGLEDDGSGAEMAVEDIEINGVDAVLISYELVEDDIISVVQMVAMPVGNTMVMSMVVAASDDLEMDTEQVRTDAENLLLAGVQHLGTVAEAAQ